MKKMTISKYPIDVYSFDLRMMSSVPLPCQCGRTPKVELIFPSDGSFYYSTLVTNLKLLSTLRVKSQV